MAFHSSPSPSDLGQIVPFLLKDRILTHDQVAEAQKAASSIDTPRPLVDILKELKYVSDDKIRATIRKNRLKIRFGQLLQELGYITSEELEQAFQVQREERHYRKIGEILVAKRFISERQLVEVLSLQMGFPLIEVEFVQIDASLFSKAPVRWYEQHRFIPVRMEQHQVLVAFADPLDPAAIEAAKQSFGERVVAAIAMEKSIQVVIKRLTTRGGRAYRNQFDDNAIHEIILSIVFSAVQSEVSDIHVEPLKDRMRVRFRRDGVLEHFKDLPEPLVQGLTSRIKVMCGADVVERRRHQLGHFDLEHNGAAISVRVSFFATIHGEKMVMRIQNREKPLIPIGAIGMYAPFRERFVKDVLEAPGGLILVTGPAASGKTTTIYSCLTHLNHPQACIVTAEEPVEYVIDGMVQCSINPRINLTYEETLRQIGLQDADIIVIGEIRDAFSAEVAVHAALKGQKVFSTLYAEDSLGGLARLLHLGVEPYLAASTVTGIISQRLLRRVCPHCAVPDKPAPAILRLLQSTLSEVAEGRFMRGRGCPKCNDTGYKGRVAVFETLIPGESIRNALMDPKATPDIRHIHTDGGRDLTLLEDGISKACQGVTTLEEVLRCLPRLGKPRPLHDIWQIAGVNP